MALIGNYSLVNRTPFKQFAGGVSSGYRDCYSAGGSDNNRHVGGYASYAGTPVGYLHPASWVMPKTTGGLTSSYSALINITNGALAQGRNVQSSISATISLSDGQISALVDLLSSISANGVFTNAQVDLLNNISSSISASATITNADIQTLSVVLLQANLAGSISITNAELGAIISLYSNPGGVGNLTAITNILVNISSDIGGATPLSPEGLAQAVWGTLSNDYIADTGTFGYQLANSGTGLSPVDIANEVWSTDISTYTIPNTAGDQLNSASGATGPTPTDIANAVWDKPVSENNMSGTFGNLIQKLLTVGKFLGLK